MTSCVVQEFTLGGWWIPQNEEWFRLDDKKWVRCEKPKALERILLGT